MKRFLFLTIFILTGLYVSAQNAVIEHVTGTVEIKQPGENSYKAANAGDKLFKETVISTGFKSFAIIKTGSTTITARPLTHLTLTEIENLSDVETLNINLQAGRVRVDVKPPAGTKAAATVKGPTVTASVRGTSFEFDTDNLYVNEGVVSFRGSKGQNILVRAGETSRLGQSGTVTIPTDEKISNLMPPSPAGTGAGESAALGSSSTGVGFTIEMEFNNGNRPK
jgi:hypothetical protein